MCSEFKIVTQLVLKSSPRHQSHPARTEQSSGPQSFYQNEGKAISQTAMFAQFSRQNSNWNRDLCWSKWDDLSGDGPRGCWLIWACQRSRGSSLRSWTALMAQQFVSTGGSFCSSSSFLQGHNLCWKGKTLQALNHSAVKTLWLNAICLWISFSISSLSLSCGFKCCCLFVRHISACLKTEWTGFFFSFFFTFMNHMLV